MSVAKPESSRCVLLFAREPRAEAAAKGFQRGEALFALARRRVVDAVAGLPDVDLVLVPPSRQKGRTFGEKLKAAFSEAAERGYAKIVAVPGDAPELTPEDLGTAFRALSFSDTILGPSPDGGVWLIGLSAGHVALSSFFERVPWRTRRVFEALLSNAPLSVVLGERSDVDVRADGQRLRHSARRVLDVDLVAALGALMGASTSVRAVKVSFACRPFLSPQAPSRAPPAPSFTF